MLFDWNLIKACLWSKMRKPNRFKLNLSNSSPQGDLKWKIFKFWVPLFYIQNRVLWTSNFDSLLTGPALVQLPQLPGNCRFRIRHSINKDIRTFKHVQLSMGCYKKSRDQLQLGLVLAIIMFTMHYILPWDDWQLQIQRHNAGLVLPGLHPLSYRNM